MTPVVSVVIDTYNHEPFIEDAIKSVLEQDFPADQMEILVVDDGSTDRTSEIVRKFEPQVRLLRKENGGQSSAINLGVDRAKGGLIALLDGDDVWLRNKLSRVVQEFAKDPRTVMVYHRYMIWDCQDDSLREPLAFAEISGDLLADKRKQRLFTGALTSALAFRRGALRRVLPVPKKCSFMQDVYLMSTIPCLGPVACIPERLTQYRIHGQNLYFMQREEINPKVLQSRVQTWEAVIGCAEDWIRVNASEQTLHSMRFLLRRWRVALDGDRFRMSKPGRLRGFVHLCRYVLVETPANPFGGVLFMWLKAFAFLIVGRRAHYLEGVRTRARRLAGHFRRRLGPVASQ